MALRAALALALLLPLFARASSSSGCGSQTSLTPGSSTKQTIVSGGIRRTYIVHLPAGYSSSGGGPVPLILSFHGNGKDAASQEALSQFSNPAWNPHAIAVYPNGVHAAWQGAPYAAAGVDDVAFIGDLLDHLESTLCVDTTRIYAAGKSVGGGFCNVLACSATASTRIAAFAPVSGAFYTGNNASSACTPARAVVPVLEFHGLSDKTIPYHGGLHQGVDLPDILDWAEAWAGRSGASTAQSDEPLVEHLFGAKVRHYTWPRGGNATQHYAIEGLGHAWPSRTPNSDNAKGTYLDATPLIMAFFGEHSLDDT